MRDTGQTNATIGKNLIKVKRPSRYLMRIIAGPKAKSTQPTDDTVSSNALTGSPSAIGLNKKNLGKVSTKAPMKMVMKSPMPATASWWLIFECSS